MRSILMSVRPKEAEKILNGEKKNIYRRRFPKDFKGWVYIYCAKDRKTKLSSSSLRYYVIDNKDYKNYLGNWNGKVVARFRCGKVYEIEAVGHGMSYIAKGASEMKIAEQRRLDAREIDEYFKGKNGCMIHFSKTETFYPREIMTFKTSENERVEKAPRGWRWIEEERA